MGGHDAPAPLIPLPTAAVCDACLRLGLPLRVAPAGLRPLRPEDRLAGPVLPARHYGSVDIFLEAMSGARPGAVLVVDNGGRTDEACIGDLVVLEARLQGLAGIVVWGAHRDGAELRRIGLPVFSSGASPTGPRRLDPAEPEALRSARVGEVTVGEEDVVFGDDDGVVFVARRDAASVVAAALDIHRVERAQADALRAGRSLREQFHFEQYLRRRAVDPAYTFRRHLQETGGAIEA